MSDNFDEAKRELERRLKKAVKGGGRDAELMARLFKLGHVWSAVSQDIWTHRGDPAVNSPQMDAAIMVIRGIAAGHEVNDLLCGLMQEREHLDLTIGDCIGAVLVGVTSAWLEANAPGGGRGRGGAGSC